MDGLRQSPNPELDGADLITLQDLRTLASARQAVLDGSLMELDGLDRQVLALAAAGESAVLWMARQLEASTDAVVRWAALLLEGRLARERQTRADGPTTRLLRKRLAPLDRRDDLSPVAREAVARLLRICGASSAYERRPDGVRTSAEHARRLEQLRRSATELALGLQTRAEVAEIAHAILGHVTEAEDLAILLTEMALQAGPAARPILDELLLRHDTPATVRSRLRMLASRRPLPAEREQSPEAPTLEPTVARWGFHVETGDGRRYLVAIGDAKGGPELRALTALVGGPEEARQGDSLSIDYHPSLSRRQMSRLLVALAGSKGRATVTPVATLRAELLVRVRSTWQTRAELPTAYYLGRDLLGLRNEHCTIDDIVAPFELPADGDSSGPREEARALIHQGAAGRAIRLLETALLSHPFDDELHELLGLALLEHGQAERALAALTRAVELKPDHALHHWNRAAAARRQRRAGRTYLALRSYLQRIDGHRHIPGQVASQNGAHGDDANRVGLIENDDAGAAARRKQARSFVRDYERLVRREFAGARAVHVALGEEMFALAFAELAAGKLTEAARGFETVVARVPTHYPSWGNLGAVYLCQGRRSDAEHCLQRALALNPSYETALRALSELKR